MIRCARCVMPDTRPDTAFVDGVCSACLAYEKRPAIDWAARKAQLLALLERHDGRCIVPSSGGKDSTYQVIELLALGARPLIVTAATCHLTAIGRANIESLASYAETIEVTPNRWLRAKLNRFGLDMVGDISWPEHVAIFTIPWRVAALTGHKLLFYGENPQNQYGGPLGSEVTVQMTRRWRSEYGGFLGLRPSDIVTMGYDMSEYMLPPEAKLEGVEAHFLGQYIPWDSHRNARVAIGSGMRFALPCQANYWDFENLDNAQTGIHDHGMYRKYGYGRGCAQISVDVRAGRVTREAALLWVEANDGRFPTVYAGVHFREVIDRIDISTAQLAQALNQFTNWKIFDENPAMFRPPSAI